MYVCFISDSIDNNLIVNRKITTEEINDENGLIKIGSVQLYVYSLFYIKNTIIKIYKKGRKADFILANTPFNKSVL